jgi:hypothetical protein
MVASCSEGQCSVACEPGFALCGADPSVGCDTNILDNVHNCGWCGHDCRGALCENGLCRPQVVAADQKNPSSLVLDSQHLYWANRDEDGAVMRAALTAGAAPEVVSADEVEPGGIALGDDAVYYTTQSAGGEVRSVDKSSLGPRSALAADPGKPGGIGWLGGALYWTSTATGEVLKLALPASGAPSPIKAGLDQPDRLAVSANGWVVYGAFGGREVYCHRSGENLRIATNVRALALAPQGDEVYWSYAEGYGIYHKSCLDVLTAPGVVLPGSAYAVGVALDSQYAYFTSSRGVGRVKLQGEASEVAQLYADVSTAVDIAVNEEWVFWADPDQGTIVKVAK